MANERLSPVEEAQLLRAAACDWRLSRGDVGVLAVILQHCDGDRMAFPGPSRIGKLANLAPTNVKASIRRLESNKYLQVTRPGERKKNRFKVLASPSIPSRKVRKIIAKGNRELGTQTGPVSGKALAATRYARMQPTGYAGVHQLGLSTRHEVAFKAPKNSQKLLASLEEEQERLAEEQATEKRLTARARELYLQAKESGDTAIMAMVVKNHRHRIADLIEKPAQEDAA